MKVTLIHNPDAGDDEQHSAEELLRLIRGSGHDPRYQSSRKTDWERALDEPAEIVAVAGGDGIVGKVAKRMIGKAGAIAILPMGTANNIAKTLGLLDLPIEQLIAGWACARRRKFDVGVANGPWGSSHFIEGVGVGLFTQTMYRLDARDNIDIAHAGDTDEKIVSVLEILRERLETCPAKSLNVTLDGYDLSGDYILLEVLNIRSVGPNLYLAPDADPGDGFLDVVRLRNGEQEILRWYLSLCIEGRPCSPDLDVRRGRHLQMRWEGSVVHIDDQVWPDTGSAAPPKTAIIDVTVDPKPLEFLAAP